MATWVGNYSGNWSGNWNGAGLGARRLRQLGSRQKKKLAKIIEQVAEEVVVVPEPPELLPALIRLMGELEAEQIMWHPFYRDLLQAQLEARAKTLAEAQEREAIAVLSVILDEF